MRRKFICLIRSGGNFKPPRQVAQLRRISFWYMHLSVCKLEGVVNLSLSCWCVFFVAAGSEILFAPTLVLGILMKAVAMERDLDQTHACCCFDMFFLLHYFHSTQDVGKFCPSARIWSTKGGGRKSTSARGGQVVLIEGGRCESEADWRQALVCGVNRTLVIAPNVILSSTHVPKSINKNVTHLTEFSTNAAGNTKVSAFMLGDHHE